MDSVITEWANGIPSRRFLVKMPSYNENGWYAQWVSYTAFCRRERKREFKTVSDSGISYVVPRNVKVCYSSKSRSEYESLLEFSNALETVYPGSDLPMLEMASIFDFYTAIGFDYKRNRYLPDSAVKQCDVGHNVETSRIP